MDRNHVSLLSAALFLACGTSTASAQTDEQWKTMGPDPAVSKAEEATLVKHPKATTADANASTALPERLASLIKNLQTPSPNRDVWKRFNAALDRNLERQLQAYLADRPKPQQVQLDATIARTRQDMLAVAGGKFVIGDYGLLEQPPYSITDDDGGPPQLVVLSDYQIKKHRVTYAEYDLFTASRGLPPVATDGFSLQYRYPDYSAKVTWHQANDYCRWLSATTNQPYALPTEAQWEYAARSRGKNYAWGVAHEDAVSFDAEAFEQQLGEKAQEHGGPDYLINSPVGLFGSNPLGLFDMIGYGDEWTHDRYARRPDWSAGKPQVVQNPRGPDSGEEHVVKQAARSSHALTITREGWGEVNPASGRPVRNSFRCVINST